MDGGLLRVAALLEILGQGSVCGLVRWIAGQGHVHPVQALSVLADLQQEPADLGRRTGGGRRIPGLVLQQLVGPFQERLVPVVLGQLGGRQPGDVRDR